MGFSPSHLQVILPSSRCRSAGLGGTHAPNLRHEGWSSSLHILYSFQLTYIQHLYMHTYSACQASRQTPHTHNNEDIKKKEQLRALCSCTHSARHCPSLLCAIRRLHSQLYMCMYIYIHTYNIYMYTYSHTRVYIYTYIHTDTGW